MKKMYLKSHPHFNFIGRYEFENKQLFVLVWRLVKVNEDVGGKDREQRMSKFLVEVNNAYCVSCNVPLIKNASYPFQLDSRYATDESTVGNGNESAITANTNFVGPRLSSRSPFLEFKRRPPRFRETPGLIVNQERQGRKMSKKSLASFRTLRKRAEEKNAEGGVNEVYPV